MPSPTASVHAVGTLTSMSLCPTPGIGAVDPRLLIQIALRREASQVRGVGWLKICLPCTVRRHVRNLAETDTGSDLALHKH